MRAHKWLIAFSLLHALPAAAAEHAEHLNFRIHHQLWGDIGTLTETVSETGSRTEVTAELDVTVNLLGIRVHTVHGRWNEFWQDGYLQQFEATTLADGETEITTGRRVGEAFVISAAGKQTTAPRDVQPVNPWSIRFVRAPTMMSPETGRVFTAAVSDRGVQAVRLGAAVVAAHHYAVTAERVNQLYFDSDGRLVRCEYGDITGTVTLTRVVAPPAVIADAR
jgi:hypothetical protein